MKYKKLIMLVIVIAVLIVGTLSLSLSKKQKEVQSPTTNIPNSPQSGFSPFEKIRTGTENGATISTGSNAENENSLASSSLESGGNTEVETKSDRPSIRTNINVKVKADEYQIVYYPESDEYIISILQIPVEVNIAKAEEAFLKEVVSSEKEACSLSVYITSPRYVDQNLSVGRLKLSFCKF